MTIHYHTVTNHQSPTTNHQPRVLAIGNMDGVHLGHQALVKTARALADANGHRCAVLTFSPHPREYFNPALKPLILMRPASKIKKLRELGVDDIIFATFDHNMAAMEAEDFITAFCVGELGAHHIVTGENFHFGRQRRGNVALLEKIMRQSKLGYSCVEPVFSPPANSTEFAMGHSSGLGRSADLPLVPGEGSSPSEPSAAEGASHARGGVERGDIQKVISSSRIRQVLSGGNVRAAAELLGGTFHLEGRVGHGDKRGRELGFPTANIPMHGLYLPAFGVYAVSTKINGVTKHGVANLGIRPTFGGERPQLEAHFFDVDENLYGQRLSIDLHHYIRPEQAFDGPQSLLDQIHQDVVKAKQFFTK